MGVHESYEQIKNDRAAAFHGRRYYYNTPDDGRRIIGVTKGLGGDYIVAWIRDNGARRAVRSQKLPADSNPDRLQWKLDVWATGRGLEEAP